MLTAVLRLFEDPLERAGWILITAIFAVVCLWWPFAPFSIAVGPFILPVATCVVLLGLAWFYRFRRPDPKISTALTHVAQMTAFTCFGAAFSYLVAANTLPLWDSAFYAADLRLGLDWRAYLAFVNEWPWLGFVFTLAYVSLIPQMIVLIIALSLSGDLRGVRVMMLSALITGLVTVILSGLMPAMAMFVHLGLTPADFPNLNPAAAFVHYADLSALRNGTFEVLDVSKVEGIVTFPSYHAALGVILLAAAWRNRWLRWPFAILNLVLIAATPIDGGHYFVDVFAGGGFAALVFWAIHRWAAQADRADVRQGSPALAPATGGTVSAISP
jgi:membrane-associated phospholipid phosphatase